jgi:hypothetical protein
VKSWSDESADEALTLRVYPGGAARLELVEDDGTTLAYQRGRFATTLLTAQPVGQALEVRVGAPPGGFDGQVEQRRLTVEMRLVKGLRGVTASGATRAPLVIRAEDVVLAAAQR